GKFISSLPGGEKQTGILRSRVFPVPNNLTFYLAGHDGYPDKPAMGKNLVRIIDARTHEVIYSTPAPRNDTAQRIRWKLQEYVGKNAYIEIVDGDNEGAFAWLAVGRFKPEVVPLPGVDPSQTDHRQQWAAELAGE